MRLKYSKHDVICCYQHLNIYTFGRYIILLVNIKKSYLNTYFKIKIIANKIIFLYKKCFYNKINIT